MVPGMAVKVKVPRQKVRREMVKAGEQANADVTRLIAQIFRSLKIVIFSGCPSLGILVY